MLGGQVVYQSEHRWRRRSLYIPCSCVAGEGWPRSEAIVGDWAAGMDPGRNSWNEPATRPPCGHLHRAGRRRPSVPGSKGQIYHDQLPMIQQEEPRPPPCGDVSSPPANTAAQSSTRSLCGLLFFLSDCDRFLHGKLFHLSARRCFLFLFQDPPPALVCFFWMLAPARVAGAEARPL